MTPSKSRSEFILVGTALLVSLCTLGVYIYQAKVMKEQQHVAVWPYMEWNTSNVEDYHFTAQNKGVGPALIRKVEMTVDGRRVANNQALIEAVLGPGAQLPHVNSSLEGRVLTPGEQVVALRIPDLKAGRDFETKLRSHDFQMRITYCSVYGECWVTDGEKIRRLPPVDLGLY